MTSWKTKGRYVTEPLNKVNSSYEKGSLNGTKSVSNDTSSEWTDPPIRKAKSRASIHKSAEEICY